MNKNVLTEYDKIPLTMRRKRIVVDQEKCIGCGLCVSLAPRTFRLNSKGKSEVVEQKGGKPEDIKNAIDSCPVKVISLRRV